MNIDRRTFLQSLALAPFVPAWLRRPGAPPRSLILLWMDGGMSHLDTFDGKPEASPDIRGEFRSLESNLEGVFVSEHLPQLRKSLQRCSLIRTITSGEGNHDRGSHYLLTGHRPSPVLTYPSLGSVRSAAAAPEDDGPMPAYVALPAAPDYGRQGFLPLLYGPFELGSNDSKPDLLPRAGAEKGLELLARVDALDGGPRSESERARDHFSAKARALSSDPRAREVFDVGLEKPEVRARYGHHRLGQSTLMARRLVQAGVRTVLVRDTGWDHHSGIKNALTYGFPPKLTCLDQALGALIEDLDRSGLAERVVVCLASEMGRTPRLNPAGGRDHWPRAHGALLFGAGVRKGCVVGRTDARGEEPAERPVSPADLFATVLAALGADLGAVLRTPDGRPVRVVEEGAAPVHEALEA